jgi:hypothetical protein
MVTRPALQELRPVVAEFAISAAVSELFTVLTLTTVRGEELSDGFRRATLAFDRRRRLAAATGVSPTIAIHLVPQAD